MSPAEFKNINWITGGLFDRIVFPLLLIIILSAAIPFGNYKLWWELVFSSIIIFVAALRVIGDLVGNSRTVTNWALIIPLLGLVTFALIQTIPLQAPSANLEGLAGIKVWWAISADPHETLRFAFKLVSLILTGYLLMRYTSSQRRLMAVVHAVIGVGSVSALMSIVQVIIGQEKFGGLFANMLPESFWQFGNPNPFAFLMEMTLGLLLGLIVGKGFRHHYSLVYGPMALLVWLALIMTSSRGGIISMIGQILFAAVLFSKLHSRLAFVEKETSNTLLLRIGNSAGFRTVMVLGILLAVSWGAFWIGGSPLQNRLDKTSDEINPSSTSAHPSARRVDIWKATLGLVRDHPVRGIGFGAYWIAISKYFRSGEEVVPFQAHNDYLEILASGGIIGIALAAWFTLALLKAAGKQLRSRNKLRRGLCFGALTGLLGVAIHSFFDFGLHNDVNALVFCTLIVVASVEYPVPAERVRRPDIHRES